MSFDQKPKTGKTAKKPTHSLFSLLPDEAERQGRPGCPGGSSSWPDGCFDRSELPDGCWVLPKKP